MTNLIPETDAGHLYQAALNLYQLAIDLRAPSMMLKPRLFIDGNQWCALHGENIQDGVAGFGKSPELAYADFDKAWSAKLPTKSGGASGSVLVRCENVGKCGPTGEICSHGKPHEARRCGGCPHWCPEAAKTVEKIKARAAISIREFAR